MPAGVAFGEDGVARGAMGIDAADYDRSGDQHLVVGNFSNQMLGLYHNEGNGLFVDEAPRSPVGRASLLNLTFGLFFFDYDLDGLPDIFAANGHLEEEIGRVQPKISYAQLPLLFRNAGGGQFDPYRESSPNHWSLAARPTPISMAMATSTSSFPPTTVPRICIAMTAAIATTGSSSSSQERRAIAMASEPLCALPVLRANRCRPFTAVPVTARQAISR